MSLGRRLSAAHQRLALFWIAAGLGLAAPWLVRLLAQETPVAPIGAQTLTCRVNSIHDGDTLRATCNGKPEQVRLYCVDAPELNQRPWGREASISPARHHPGDPCRSSPSAPSTAPGTARAAWLPRCSPAAPRTAISTSRWSGAATPRSIRATAARGGYFRMEAAARKAAAGILGRAGDQQQPRNFRRKS